MKKITFSLFVFSLIAATIYLSSCKREDSVDINQDRIFTIYELEYDADADLTKVKATFRIGGKNDSKIKLSDGSNISFNNQNLDFKSVYAYYQEDFTGLTDTGTFKFKDLDGNTYTNTISANPVEFPDTVNDIVKGNAYEINWEGPALSENEKMKLTINGPLDSDTKTFEVTAVGKTKIALGSTETSKLSAGANILELERIYESNILEAPSVGGEIKSTYRSFNKAINISE